MDTDKYLNLKTEIITSCTAWSVKYLNEKMDELIQKVSRQAEIETANNCNKDCWEWNGSFKPDGYGQISIHGRSVNAHRVSWAIKNGAMPPGRKSGMVVHHKCENKSCVNPFHLELVTNKHNVLIGNGPTAKNKKKTKCPKGHRYTKENTYINNGKRECRICNYIKNKIFRQERKLANQIIKGE